MQLITLGRKLWRGCLSRQFECILSTVDHTGISQTFSPQLGVSYFLCRGSVISRSKTVRIFTRDKQEVCPRYDNNRNAPIGCFVIKDYLMTMGVIHQ